MTASAGPGSLSSVLEGRDLHLETLMGIGPEGATARPRFFDGFANAPEQTARGILAVANVAATSYWRQLDMSLLDPVVTNDGERLRFESFSGCGGVYARLDVLPEGLDGTLIERGTTNVDVNEPLRRALALLRGVEPLHLAVGPDDLTVRTLDDTVVEKKVKLPPRWVRGFAEAPAATTGMRQMAEVPAAEARRFLRSFTRSGADTHWVQGTGRTLRVTSRPGPDSVCLAGTGRLRELEPLLRYATTLRLFGPDPTAGRGGATPAASAWQLDLDGARLTLTLSPEMDRGFSGEGGVLESLARGSGGGDPLRGVEALASQIIDLLAWLPGSDPETIALALDAGTDRVRDALTVLATSGRVGFDLADGTYFHRELPFHPERATKDNPRLVSARALVAADALAADGPGAVVVTSENSTQRVRRASDGTLSCTCPWWRAYAGTRGPCKHVLAVQISDRGEKP